MPIRAHDANAFLRIGAEPQLRRGEEPAQWQTGAALQGLYVDDARELEP